MGEIDRVGGWSEVEEVILGWGLEAMNQCPVGYGTRG